MILQTCMKCESGECVHNACSYCLQLIVRRSTIVHIIRKYMRGKDNQLLLKKSIGIGFGLIDRGRPKIVQRQRN